MKHSAMQGRAFYDDHFERRRNGKMNNVTIDLTADESKEDHNDDQLSRDCEDMPN